jgi:hypothetical protein
MFDMGDKLVKESGPKYLRVVLIRPSRKRKVGEKVKCWEMKKVDEA